MGEKVQILDKEIPPLLVWHSLPTTFLHSAMLVKITTHSAKKTTEPLHCNGSVV
jgi:hypothetical protein